jgi:hypothetical protein
VKAYSFFIVPALAVALAYGASSKRLEPDPAESQMESSFSRYFSKLSTRTHSTIQFTTFRKNSCVSTTASRHYCNFSYSTRTPAGQLSILPAHGTISGMFSVDDDGQLTFDMAIG